MYRSLVVQVKKTWGSKWGKGKRSKVEQHDRQAPVGPTELGATVKVRAPSLRNPGKTHPIRR